MVFTSVLLLCYNPQVIATVGNESKREFLVSKYGLKPEQIIVRAGGGSVFAAQLQSALRSVDAEVCASFSLCCSLLFLHNLSLPLFYSAFVGGESVAAGCDESKTLQARWGFAGRSYAQ